MPGARRGPAPGGSTSGRNRCGVEKRLTVPSRSIPPRRRGGSTRGGFPCGSGSTALGCGSGQLVGARERMAVRTTSSTLAGSMWKSRVTVLLKEVGETARIVELGEVAPGIGEEREVDDVRHSCWAFSRRSKHASIRTVKMVLRVSGHSRLLEANPVLDRSIRLRNPYVDPMSLIQVTLLRRKRAGNNTEELNYALAATINGIAAGLHKQDDLHLPWTAEPNPIPMQRRLLYCGSRCKFFKANGTLLR